MESYDQVPFGAAEFAANPEPRCPCLLLLDTSASMRGNAIAELNDGLVAFQDELAADELAAKRVEVAIVTFGPARAESAFETAGTFLPPTLEASGATPMGEAIEIGLSMIEDRKRDYKEGGVTYYRPWVFLITDGAPTDDWSAAASAIRRGESDNAFAFFAVAVENANMEILSQIAHREPLRLDGLRFRDLFKWLSASVKSVSHSRPGDEVALDNPAAPGGWASV